MKTILITLTKVSGYMKASANDCKKPVTKIIFLCTLLLATAFHVSAQSDDIILDNCDVITGWTATVTADATTKQEGAASLLSTGSGSTRFRKAFTAPVNISQLVAGYLKFWFYISDITALGSGGQVEISSAGAPDAQEIRWNVNTLNLRNGWNYIVLKISEGSPTGAAIDLSRLNFFRFYNTMTKTVDTRIDDIRFSSEPIVCSKSTLAVTLDANSPNCAACTDGNIASFVTGGHAPYTYAWSTGSTANFINGLKLGDYTLAVTDAMGCVVRAGTTVESFCKGSSLKVIIDKREPSAASGCVFCKNGWVKAITTGGTAPYTYLWNSGRTLDIINEIGPGCYDVTVTDAAGCIRKAEGCIGMGPESKCIYPKMDEEIKEISCHGSSDGEIKLSLPNTLPPGHFSLERLVNVEYNWSDFGNGANRTGLSPGKYTYQVIVNTESFVTDGTPVRKSCMVVSSIVLNEANPITVNLKTLIAPSCPEALNGVIESEVAGGRTPYQYRWDNSGDLVFHSVDNKAGWNPSTAVIDASNNKEGAGCLSFTGNNTDRFWRVFTPVDVSRFANGYLKFWFYVSDVTAFTGGGQVEITSGGVQDTQEKNWNVNTLGLHNGWNYVVLKISSGGTTGGAIDLSRVNFMRIYKAMTKSVETRIDDIRFSNDAGALLDNGDKITDWKRDSRFTIAVDKQVKREGEGSIRTIGGNGGGTRCSKVFDPINANVTKETGYLKLWLYASDVTKFSSNGAIEITSAGKADTLELSWRTDRLNLRNGWNPVVLKLSEGTRTSGGDTDLTKISYFRFARNTSDTITTQVDDIQFSDNGNPLKSEGSPNQRNAGPGIYTLQVTDASGCSASATIDIKPQSSTPCSTTCPLVLTFRGDNATCNGVADGRIFLGIEGGSGQYEYLWSNQATTKDIGSLAAGAYTVTVKDKMNPRCSGVTGQHTIQQPAPLTVSVVSTNPNICGGGSVTLTATTNAPQLLWLPGGEQTAGIQVRTPGVYVATVRNGNCKNQADITIGHAPTTLDIQTSRVTICVERRETAVLTSPLPSNNRWFNTTGPTTRSVTVSTPGVYTLSTTLTGCTVSTGTIEIIADCGGPGGGPAPQESPLCNPTFIPVPEQEESTCQTFTTSVAISNATYRYNEYLGQMRRDFSASYIQHCLNTYEELSLSYSDSRKHFTLLYYDQSGNLTRTVPPAGVQLLDPASLPAVQTARVSNQPGIKPAHKMTTDYQYNSLNQKIFERVPDQDDFEVGAGRRVTTRYFYDEVGRMVLSQNAMQLRGAFAAPNHKDLYSYILYDQIDRVIEVGELLTTAALPVTGESQLTYASLKTFIQTGTTRQITRTFYDKAAFAIPGPTIPTNIPGPGQKNLRNRIATVATYETSSSQSYAYATHYSYNAHGYVETVVQENPSMANVATFVFGTMSNRYKRIDYVFDMVSGNVKEMHYQKGFRDQFFHRYTFDADSRLAKVETSRDYIIWDRDAEYRYYEHGPLSRMELGEDRVQGMDFAYTIQGWTKGINSLTLKTTDDMGVDGSNANIRRATGKDVFGYGLNYFRNDYKSIGAGDTDFEQMDAGVATNLYDGNISGVSTSLSSFMSSPGVPQLSQYRYDRLGRLRSSRNYDLSEQANGSFTATAHNLYRTFVEYDPNGNITRLKRNAHVNTNTQGTAMDDLTYIYENPGSGYAKTTNHLKAVTDARTGTPNTMGDIKPGQTFDATDPWAPNNNYKYNASGQLFSDKQEGVTAIDWNIYGKPYHIFKENVASIDYKYDGLGNRVMKDIISFGTTTTLTKTWYVYDVQGKLMATYVETGSGNLTTLALTELPIYGVSRLGERSVNVNMLSVITDSKTTDRVLAQSRYELNDHLGNVKAIVSGEKQVVSGSYVPNVLSATDYYPFGMTMPNRNLVNGQPYRFGFNGKEKDDEIKGANNSYDFGGRSIYDPRLGRFVSIDPKFRDFASMSPYAFAANSPIQFIDEGGLNPNRPTVGQLYANAYATQYGDMSLPMPGTPIDPATESQRAKVLINVATMVIPAATTLRVGVLAGAVINAAVGTVEDGIDGNEVTPMSVAKHSVWGAALAAAGHGVSKGIGYVFRKYATEVAPKAEAIGNKVDDVAKTSCFVAGTEILTAGGKFIAIEKIRTEEELYRLPAELINSIKEKVNSDELIKVIFDGWEITTTKDQLFYTEDGWKKAGELKAGDQIVKIQGGTWEVKEVIVMFSNEKEITPITPAEKEQTEKK